MSRFSTVANSTNRGLPVPLDEHDELSDIPLTPREGWTSLVALTVMVVVTGIAIDDAKWVGYIGNTTSSQTGFLPACGLLSVLVGALLAKSRLGKYSAHLVGAVVGAAFLLVAISASISTAPSIEARLHELNLSVSTFIGQVVVQGERSSETSIFLLTLGTLLWAAGQFSAFCVFRFHRPVPAILLTGVMLLVNVSITVRDEYPHLIVFVAASLLLLVRLNLLQQVREWRSRGMRDVGGISDSFLRQGAVFVALAIVAATTLAANASSAPLQRAWHNVDDELLEVGYAINRWLGGVSGSARGPNILFAPSQTIRGVWESSSEIVFTGTSSDGVARHWRGATYDSFDGRTWEQLDRQVATVAVGDSVLGPTSEIPDDVADRKIVDVTVTPADYGGDVIVAPESPFSADQQVQVLTNGTQGPFVAAKLLYGIQQGVPYSVRSAVHETAGPDALTAGMLASASLDYPQSVNRYLEIRPGSIGQSVYDTARGIVNSLPSDKRDVYHIAFAVQEYLYRTGGFTYRTDVRGMCDQGQLLVDCFLETKQGYCEYFATAMVMMLRALDIPSRYVLGYLPGRAQKDGSWIVDRSAAHAWVEVYFPGYGWVEFDPTPGNGENGQAETNLIAGEDLGPAPTRKPLEGRGELECADRIDCSTPGAVEPIAPSAPPPAPRNDALAPAIVVGSIGLLLALLAFWARRRRLAPSEPELAYASISRMASRLGYGPRPYQTVYEFAAGLGELVPVARSDLQLIATAKVEATYGHRPPVDSVRRLIAAAYRRVQFGLLRLVIRRPRFGRRPRDTGFGG